MFDAASLFFAETIMASSKAKPAPKKTADARDIVRAVFKAYEKKDRAAIEAVLADDFHFTSPLDNPLFLFLNRRPARPTSAAWVSSGCLTARSFAFCRNWSGERAARSVACLPTFSIRPPRPSPTTD